MLLHQIFRRVVSNTLIKGGRVPRRNLSCPITRWFRPDQTGRNHLEGVRRC